MTREEALAYEVEYLTCDDELIVSNIPVEECAELINKIFDYFENHSCNSCEYYISNKIRQLKKCSELGLRIPKDLAENSKFKRSEANEIQNCK